MPRKMHLLLLVALSSVFINKNAFSSAPDPAPVTPWGMLSFRANQLSMFQSQGSSYSGGISWNPGWKLGDGFGIRAVLGGALVKGALENFPIADAELLFVIAKLEPWGIEIGPGAQKWFGSFGGLAASGNLVVTYPIGTWLVAFAGYTPLFAPGNFTHEIKVGAGIQL